jgi:hypothetical protein
VKSTARFARGTEITERKIVFSFAGERPAKEKLSALRYDLLTRWAS